jgi:hypothetical protein
MNVQDARGKTLDAVVQPSPMLASRPMDWIMAFGVAALAFMLVMYALEGRAHGFILAFAIGCALSSVYGFLSGTWPFGVVEAVWCLIAVRRFALARNP